MPFIEANGDDGNGNGDSNDGGYGYSGIINVYVQLLRWTMLFGRWFSSLFVGRFDLPLFEIHIVPIFNLSLAKNNNITYVWAVCVSVCLCEQIHYIFVVSHYVGASSRRRNGNLCTLGPFFLLLFCSHGITIRTSCDCCKLSLDLFHTFHSKAAQRIKINEYLLSGNMHLTEQCVFVGLLSAERQNRDATCNVYSRIWFCAILNAHR